MGFFSGIRRRIKKIIPKEIRPAIPFIAAAMIPGAGVAGLGPVKSKFLTSAIARGLSDDEADVKDIFRAGALAAAPTAISGGLGDFAQKYGAVGDTAEKATMLTRAADLAGKAKEGIEGTSALKTVGAQSAVDFGMEQAELNEKALEQYNADLLSKGIKDKASRRSAIFNIFSGAGYDEDEVNAMLDKYGYADGGRVNLREGGGMLETMKKLKDAGFSDKQISEILLSSNKEDEEEKFSASEFSDNLTSGISGLEKAFGQPLGGRRPEPMRIIPGFAMGGDVDEVMETEEEIITPDYLMKEEGVEIGEQVSSPNAMDELNSLSLDMFGKPVFELTEDEFEALKDLASQQALKPGLIDDYRNYKYQMEEQGITPMSPRDYFRNEFGAARLGVAKGGPVEININAGGNNMEDIKGQTAGPDWYYDRIQALEFEFGDELTPEEIADIAFDSDKFYDKMGYDPGDYKKGGKVIKIMPQGVLFKGKAKDYPGIKQLIKDMKKKGTRDKKAEGGLMNLGGKEMDLRGGGFVPMGKKERADDVPARLSKNEFVFTADAVRAAGGGSVQKGADLMYDTMKKLEAQS